MGELHEGWRRTVGRLLGPMVSFGLVLGGAWWAGQRWTPARAEVAVDPDARVVVLGSSIALANVDANRLAGALGPPRVTVAQLGERASQPAHWLALMRHAVPAAGARPEVVVLVTPLDVLLRERLRADTDQARLLALLGSPDPLLWSAAVGTDGHARFWGRQQVAARHAIHAALAGWLPRLLGLSEDLSRARESASALPRAVVDKPTWLVDPAQPSPGRAAAQPMDREPMRGTVAGWQLAPLMVAAAADLGATLWVVAPPVRPSERGPRCSRSRETSSVHAALEQLGAVVVDATDAELPPEVFRTRYHLEGDGPAAFTDGLAAALRNEDTGWPDCVPTRGRAGG